MGTRNGYKAEQFIKAIPGSGGIISTIANRVGCEWHTAKRYIDEYPTVQSVYLAEKETLKDLAESVILKNIELAKQAQEETGQQQDTGDAKWYLSRLAKDRGYIERQEIDHSGNIESTLVILPAKNDK